MPLKSCVISGTCEKLTLSLGVTERIFEGTWELALSSISFHFKNDLSSSIVKISSNYVSNLEVNSNGSVSRQPACLNMIFLAGTANKKKLIGFKQRDFFEINNVEQDFKIFLTNAETNKPLSGITTYVHVLLRRTR